MNHDDCFNWGPKIGGSRDSYTAINGLGLKTGDPIRIHIPGLYPIETTVTVTDFDIVTVTISGRVYYVGDRTNGMLTDHNWKVQFAKRQPTRPEAIEALPVGTMFFVSPDAVSSRSVYLRTTKGVTNVTKGQDLTIDGDNFGYVAAASGFPYIIGRLETA